MLTKSDFRRFLDCPNEFWLDANCPQPEVERTLEGKHRREEGYDVQRHAAKLAIFQPREGIVVETPKKFETADLSAISDFVLTDLATGEIDIYEAKGTTDPSDKKHLADVAFQAHVARLAGYKVRNLFLVTCSKEYVRDGEIDYESLIAITDITEKATAIAEETSSNVEAALTFHLHEPSPSLLEYCGHKLDCRFIRRHFPNIPEYNVSHVFNQGKKLPELLKLGILDIREVPSHIEPTPRQQRQIDVEISGLEYRDVAAIRSELAGLKYPLCFLDYEAFGYAIPPYDGMKPYEPVLFQYSLHIVREPDAEPEAYGYLSRGDGRHPAEETAEQLAADLASTDGSVIVWSKTYERRCNEITGRVFPAYSDFFASLNERLYDLRDIFQKQYYLHPAQRGSDSIKAVLPALFPDDPSYKDLGIGGGNDAQILWYHMSQGRGGETACEKIYADLIEYCALDTLAMVKVHRFLAAL